jgi:steroid 5-alpha reductase family enzyme
VSAIGIYFVGLAAALGLMTVLWLISLALRNSSIVDIFWGAGFVLLVWLYFALAPQGILMWLVSAPLLAAQIGATPRLTILDGLGALLWAIGFFFEAAGDWQLARFKANPANKGQVMNRGVWRYTRHPNYFGDAAQWWGFFLIALAAGGWITVLSPLLMTFLLVRVSGKALLEKSMAQRPGYREYVESTSGFVPWFPRKAKGKAS